MQNYDVIIVGAGPAGAATALNIHKYNPELAPKTLLLDAATFPREKICAGGITGKGEKSLEAIGLGIETPFAPVHQVRLINGDKVVEVYRHGTCKVIRRDEFDTYLARSAAKRGAVLKEGEKVVDVKRDGNGWVVRTSKNEYTGKILVGADGVNSIVRKKLNFPAGQKNTRLFLIETPVDETRTHEFLYKSFTFDFTYVPRGLQGYIWDFPCYINGKPYMNRGLMDRNPNYSNRQEVVNLFREAMTKRGVELDEFKMKWFPERGYLPSATLSQPGAILIGEAAGVDPLLGEGIAECFEYGEIAADEVLQALRSGDTSFRNFTKHVRKSKLGVEMRGMYHSANLFYGKYFKHAFGIGIESPEIMEMGMKYMTGEANPSDENPIKGLFILLKAVFRYLLKSQ